MQVCWFGCDAGCGGCRGRLIASYILVTLVVVVLVEAVVLGFQVPSLVNSGQLQAQVDAAAQSYAGQLSQRYPGGVPAGTVLGDPGQPAQPGLARPAPDGTLVVPAITGPIAPTPCVARGPAHLHGISAQTSGVSLQRGTRVTSGAWRARRRRPQR